MFATIAAVDIFADGHLQLLRAGDCWLAKKDLRGWAEVFSGEARSEQSLKRFADLGGWQPENYRQQYKNEQLVFSDPGAWESTPVGYFPELKIQSKRLTPEQWQQIMLGSDGVAPEGVAETTSLANRPQEHFAPNGDQTLLIASRATDSQQRLLAN